MEESEQNPPKTLKVSTRHKCAACFQQFKKKEHLIAHMKISYHSAHQPKCGVCQKHCKSFESLREHISGPLAKAHCSIIFSRNGCQLCLEVFESPISLGEHEGSCLFTAPVPLGTTNIQCNEYEAFEDENYINKCPEVVAIDCQMIGCGSDGSLDLLARVCLVNEEENMIFHTYVKPQISVTDYRYELTGITEEHLRDAMPLAEVREKISQILYNGESIGKARLDGGKAKLLVGHNLNRYLDCLLMNYPERLLSTCCIINTRIWLLERDIILPVVFTGKQHDIISFFFSSIILVIGSTSQFNCVFLCRDTATYRPLMKTNFASHSLKYLTKTYLGYDIRLATHDTFQDCVSVMRLYKRMRASSCRNNTKQSLGFDARTLKDLENMSPDELFQISVPNYRCWCLDSRPSDWNY